MPNDLFSVAEAAEYLGLSRRGIQWHVYNTKLLQGTKVGKTLVFTRQELDDFRSKKPKPGPKPQEE